MFLSLTIIKLILVCTQIAWLWITWKLSWIRHIVIYLKRLVFGISWICHLFHPKSTDIVHVILLRKVVSEWDNEIWIKFNNTNLSFGLIKFAIISGLNTYEIIIWIIQVDWWSYTFQVSSKLWSLNWEFVSWKKKDNLMRMNWRFLFCTSFRVSSFPSHTMIF